MLYNLSKLSQAFDTIMELASRFAILPDIQAINLAGQYMGDAECKRKSNG